MVRSCEEGAPVGRGSGTCGELRTGLSLGGTLCVCRMCVQESCTEPRSFYFCFTCRVRLTCTPANLNPAWCHTVSHTQCHQKLMFPFPSYLTPSPASPSGWRPHPPCAAQLPAATAHQRVRPETHCKALGFPPLAQPHVSHDTDSRLQAAPDLHCPSCLSAGSCNLRPKWLSQ